MSDYYNRDGTPMSKEDWMESFGVRDRKIVKVTDVDGASVSTVWLGLDHSFGAGPPLIFETMVFGGPLDQEQWRYSTEQDALEDHERIVSAVRAKEHA